MRTFIAVIQFIAGLAVAAAAHAAEPVRIGLSLGLTGTYAEPARMQMRAYRRWDHPEDKLILDMNSALTEIYRTSPEAALDLIRLIREAVSK